MNCPRPRCGQLMLRDPDDPGEMRCPSCSTSTYRAPPDTLAHERDNENRVHGHRGITARAEHRDVITRRFA